MDAVCLGTASGRLPRPGHRYMQLDALRAYIMDVHYGMLTGSDSERSLSVLSVELRLRRRRRVYMECDSNVGCVTEHYAECTAETAEHFESRRSAERSHTVALATGRG